jgi:two-component system sensor histidine kinase DegS
VIEFVHVANFHRLAPPLESALFRIAQESLNNACRHSHSDRVRIELTQFDNTIHLDVRDWGIGFTPENIEEQRFGLQGIRERARLLGGNVTIESEPGKGTHVAVELPLIDSEGGTMGND